MTRARVLLADDHRIVADGLRGLLEPEFELVGSVEDGRAMVATANELNPDVVVADISMPLLNGIEAAQQLRKSGSKAKVIFLTMHPDVMYAMRAFDAGAAGFVLKHSAASELVNAIREVLEGRTYITPLLAKELIEAYSERGAAQRRSAEQADSPTARSPSAPGRGPLRERDRRCPERLAQNGRVPQVSHDGGARHPHQRRAHPVRHPPRSHLGLGPYPQARSLWYRGREPHSQSDHLGRSARPSRHLQRIEQPAASPTLSEQPRACGGNGPRPRTTLFAGSGASSPAVKPTPRGRGIQRLEAERRRWWAALSSTYRIAFRTSRGVSKHPHVVAIRQQPPMPPERPPHRPDHPPAERLHPPTERMAILRLDDEVCVIPQESVVHHPKLPPVAPPCQRLLERPHEGRSPQ